MKIPYCLPSSSSWRPAGRSTRAALVGCLGLLALAPARAGRSDDFIRGDVAQNGALEITDSIAIFGFLFLGAREPLCLKSADANDDGRNDLSDGIYLLQFLFNGGAAPPAPFPGCGADPTQDRLTCESYATCTTCIERALERVEEWRRQGLEPLEIERRLQAAITGCLGPSVDSATARLVGAANVDYARLARQMLSGDMDPADYLQRVRDRARKMRLARRDPSWAPAFARGDEDGDLVPDDRDRCPGTSDLAPTDDAGCPSREDPPPAPSAREVRLTLERLGILYSPGCDGAPLPQSVTPLKLGYNNVDRSTLNIAVVPITNQPAGCHVFYEVQVRMWAGGVGAGLPPVSYAQMVFRAEEDTDANPDRVVFRTRATDVGGRKTLFDRRSHYTYATWSVRAVNGNGYASAWSAPVTARTPSFGEP